LFEHVLPAVLQLGLRAWQVPLHRVPQHAALAVQAWPSERHCVLAQTPFAPQLSEQQSVGERHDVPAGKHLSIGDEHVCNVGSQTPLQQVTPLVQGSLKVPHERPPSMLPASVVTDASAPVAPPVAPPEPLMPPVPTLLPP